MRGRRLGARANGWVFDPVISNVATKEMDLWLGNAAF